MHISLNVFYANSQTNFYIILLLKLVFLEGVFFQIPMGLRCDFFFGGGNAYPIPSATVFHTAYFEFENHSDKYIVYPKKPYLPVFQVSIFEKGRGAIKNKSWPGEVGQCMP